MSLSTIISTLLGGAGLFLLGMWLMTDGLKLAAGAMLRNVLAAWTRTPMRGFVTGTGLTATLQSSSAVTVATVGFVNAGLLTLSQAVWVIYGSNVGTTLTGWIVALTGVEVKLDAYALPAVGIGMVLRLSSPGSRRAAYGQALAGFAVFLLGIQALKSGFSDAATSIDFSALPATGWAGVAVNFSIGVVLTFLIQSSSATSAIAISATAAGVVPVQSAALVIIGADLGTSSTAALAAVGATAGARRAAAAHVTLNLVTAGFAVLALEPLLAASAWIQAAVGLPESAGVRVALFGTAFNIAGVVLMLPFTRAMVAALERRFRYAEEDLATPRHLDATLSEVPELAVRALVLEVQRLGRACLDLAATASASTGLDREAIIRRETAITTLAGRIRANVGRLNRSRFAPEAAADVPALLRALQHYEEVADHAAAAKPLGPIATPWFAELRPLLTESTRAALAAADTTEALFDIERMHGCAAAAEQVYERLKAELLEAAADGAISVSAMDEHMQDIARLHRAVERAVKAAIRIAPHRSDSAPDRPEPA